METGRKPCTCVLCQCLLGRLGPQGLAGRFGQAGSARWGPLARSCAESALVPRDPSPSAEALLPTASPTLSWSQWRSAPASPAACECRAWGLGEGLGWLRRAVVSVVVAIGARTGGSYQEHQCAAGTCWGQHGNRLISASSRPHRCAAPAWGRVWGLGPGAWMELGALSRAGVCRGQDGAGHEPHGAAGEQGGDACYIRCRREQKYSRWEFPDWIPLVHKWTCLSERYCQRHREGEGPEGTHGTEGTCGTGAACTQAASWGSPGTVGSRLGWRGEDRP